MKQLKCSVLLFCLIIGMNSVKAQTSNGLQLRSAISNNEHSVDRQELTQNQLICAQEEIAKLQENNYNLKKTLASLENEISKLKQEKLALQNDANIVLINSLNKNNADKINELSLLIEQNKKDLEDKNSLINQKELLIADLQNKIVLSNRENDNSIKISELNSQLNTEKTNLLEKNSIISQKEQELSALKQQISNYENKITELTGQIAIINDKMAQKEKEFVLIKQTNQTQSNLSNNNDDMMISKLKEQMASDSESSAMLYYNLAKVYEKQNDYKNAINCYEKTLESNPKYTKAYCDIGLAYAESKNYEQAIVNLEMYAKTSTNPEEIKVITNFISQLKKNV